MDNSKKIIDKIKSEKIQPIPRWRFILKNTAVWAAFILAVALGSISFSIVLFSIQQTDFDLISHMSHSKLEFFLGLLPFFWILSLIIFLLLAIYSIQYSKKGYKLTISRLVGASAALSILAGTLFFIGGGAGKLENAFANKISLYESLQEKKMKIWMNPQEGFLSGTISDTGIDLMHIEDFEGKIWEVHYEGAFIPPVVLLEQGEKVKIIGKLLDKKTFQAEEIRPWGGPENRVRRQGRQGN
ncbi:MAG: hypothetical protein KDC85_20060 [Saprospiraceae bacterium]|nr:hypothetical protein [Saprospiraceae bacterium]MCB9327054.1 hypothetical protein [Lewinellaceae bacterium]